VRAASAPTDSGKGTLERFTGLFGCARRSTLETVQQESVDLKKKLANAEVKLAELEANAKQVEALKKAKAEHAEGLRQVKREKERMLRELREQISDLKKKSQEQQEEQANQISLSKAEFTKTIKDLEEHNKALKVYNQTLSGSKKQSELQLGNLKKSMSTAAKPGTHEPEFEELKRSKAELESKYKDLEQKYYGLFGRHTDQVKKFRAEYEKSKVKNGEMNEQTNEIIQQAEAQIEELRTELGQRDTQLAQLTLLKECNDKRNAENLASLKAELAERDTQIAQRDAPMEHAVYDVQNATREARTGTARIVTLQIWGLPYRWSVEEAKRFLEWLIPYPKGWNHQGLAQYRNASFNYTPAIRKVAGNSGYGYVDLCCSYAEKYIRDFDGKPLLNVIGTFATDNEIESLEKNPNMSFRLLV